MAPQLELDLTRARPALPRPRERFRRAGRTLLAWTPLWVPGLFLGQMIVLGLLPARSEARRLDRAEEEVRTRARALESERDELETEARMLSDEIYRERVRRSLRDPAAAPLTLESARRTERP